MNKQAIADRKAELQQQLVSKQVVLTNCQNAIQQAQTQAQQVNADVNAINGALQDCDFWLNKLADEASENVTQIKPGKHERLLPKQN